MKKFVVGVAAAAVAAAGLVPALAADKIATETGVPTNGVAVVHAKGEEELTVNGKGTARLDRWNKNKKKWINGVKSSEIQFESNIAYYEALTIDKGGKCRVKAKYHGNAKFAASPWSKGWKTNCKTGYAYGL